MYNLIFNVNEMREFHSILHPLQPSEAYFVSMSARNKYLSEEERKEFELGRSEMFARKLVKDTSFEDFLRVIRSLEVNEGGYTTRNHKPIPEKCLVTYVNINASNGMNALKEFNERSNALMFDCFKNKDAMKTFASLDSMLMNCYQRQRGTKHFIDIDFDVPKTSGLMSSFVSHLKLQAVKYHVIETKGGYHVLMERATIKHDYNKVLVELDRVAKELYEKAEIVRNVNDMVPLPGTHQAGFPVRLLKE